MRLWLPKWEAAASDHRTRPVLQALGMTHAFDVPRAARISVASPRAGRLTISASRRFFHQSRVEIDEHGTEASAATAAIMMQLTARYEKKPEPVEVRVDRPFLFAIQHRPSGACLFLGHVTDPR